MNQIGSQRCRLASAGYAAAVALAASSPATANADILRTYPVPAALIYTAHNDDYTVRVRAPGGEWKDLYEYRIQVDTDTKQNASLVYFDFEGRVELEVLKNNGRFSDVSIAPLSSTIRPIHNGMVTRLTLDRPESFSLQFDGDRLHNLHIIAGKLPPSLFWTGVAHPPGGQRDLFGTIG
jgi:hypothetical protein